jgi:hypothetical protein
MAMIPSDTSVSLEKGTGDQEYGNHWQQTEPIKRTKDPPDNVHIDPLKSPYEIHNTELG